jgi:hypothetical protein
MPQDLSPAAAPIAQEPDEEAVPALAEPSDGVRTHSRRELPELPDRLLIDSPAIGNALNWLKTHENDSV